MSNTMRLLPPTNPLHLKKKKKEASLTPWCLLTLAPRRDLKLELLGVALEMEACGSVPN